MMKDKDSYSFEGTYFTNSPIKLNIMKQALTIESMRKK